MPSEESFGKLLFQLRKRAKLTQRQLAQAMKVDYTYISKIESSKAPPPHRDRIELAAKAVDATADEAAKLFRLAEKIPEDVSLMIAKNADALRLFRRIREVPIREQPKLLDELIRKVEAREKARKQGSET